MVQVVVEVDGGAAPPKQGAVECHLLLDEVHQGRREAAAVQCIDGGSQAWGQGVSVAGRQGHGDGLRVAGLATHHGRMLARGDKTVPRMADSVQARAANMWLFPCCWSLP